MKAQILASTAALACAFSLGTATAQAATQADPAPSSHGRHHHGQDHGRHHHGKYSPSRLTAKAVCRVSKRNNDQWWKISNVSGNRGRQFWAWVYYPGVRGPHIRHGWLHLPNGRGSYHVKAHHSKWIKSPYGGGLAVHYYNGYGHLKKLWVESDSSVLCHMNRHHR